MSKMHVYDIQDFRLVKKMHAARHNYKDECYAVL